MRETDSFLIGVEDAFFDFITVTLDQLCYWIDPYVIFKVNGKWLIQKLDF